MANIGKPLADRVLLKLEDISEKKSSGGIILNQTTQSVQNATVVAISDGFIGTNGDFIKLTVKEGDKVLINNGSGQKIRIEREDYILIRESEILILL